MRFDPSIVTVKQSSVVSQIVRMVGRMVGQAVSLSLLRWPKSVMAISICSRQFQFVHGNFNLFTAISICSRQFQFQLVHGNFNLLKAISIFSRQCSRHFSLRSPPVNFGVRQWPPKVKTQNRKSIFKVDLQSEK